MIQFVILRWIHELDFFKNNPEIRTFLWGDSNDTLLINLNITSLPCIPLGEIINSTFEDLTTLVS